MKLPLNVMRVIFLIFTYLFSASVATAKQTDSTGVSPVPVQVAGPQYGYVLAVGRANFPGHYSQIHTLEMDMNLFEGKPCASNTRPSVQLSVAGMPYTEKNPPLSFDLYPKGAAVWDSTKKVYTIDYYNWVTYESPTQGAANLSIMWILTCLPK